MSQRKESPIESPLDVAIDVLSLANCGDHAERVRVSHQYDPGETVEEMVPRVLPNLGYVMYRTQDPAEWIEIRVRVGPDGQVTGQAPPPTVAADPWANPGIPEF